MTEHDPNDFEATGPDAPNDSRSNSETYQPVERPYGDAGNLYDIPRIRHDDPPMREWWIDDEPQNGNSQSG